MAAVSQRSAAEDDFRQPFAPGRCNWTRFQGCPGFKPGDNGQGSLGDSPQGPNFRSDEMIEQKSGSFGKRKIWIGGAIAAAAVVLVMSSGIDFPPGSKDTAGTIVPATALSRSADTGDDGNLPSAQPSGSARQRDSRARPGTRSRRHRRCCERRPRTPQATPDAVQRRAGRTPAARTPARMTPAVHAADAMPQRNAGRCTDGSRRMPQCTPARCNAASARRDAAVNAGTLHRRHCDACKRHSPARRRVQRRHARRRPRPTRARCTPSGRARGGA